QRQVTVERHRSAELSAGLDGGGEPRRERPSAARLSFDDVRRSGVDGRACVEERSPHDRALASKLDGRTEWIAVRFAEELLSRPPRAAPDVWLDHVDGAANGVSGGTDQHPVSQRRNGSTERGSGRR